jgi:hypothetical protein
MLRPYLDRHGCGRENEALSLWKSIVQKGDGLNAGHVKAFAAADVLAHGHIVTADHIRLRLGELGAVALVGAAWQLPFLGAHQP